MVRQMLKLSDFHLSHLWLVPPLGDRIGISSRSLAAENYSPEQLRRVILVMLCLAI